MDQDEKSENIFLPTNGENEETFLENYQQRKLLFTSPHPRGLYFTLFREKPLGKNSYF